MSAIKAHRPAAHLIGPPLERPLDQWPATISAAIDRAADAFPLRGIMVRDRSGRSGERRTYPEVAKAVRAAAAAWQAQGVKAGDRVLIAVPTSWEFVSAWLGAIYLGAHPAAIPPLIGEVTSDSVSLHKLEQFRDVIDATRILAPERAAADLRRLQPDRLGAAALTAAELMVPADTVIAPAPSHADDIAFLQFTSGSTGTPRAVMVRHRMAVHNALALNESMRGPNGECGADFLEAVVAWLPLHHDMGLIGCLLYPLVCGLDLDLLNPQTFLGRPVRYLEALHHRSVVTSAPNFGYQYCVDRLQPADVAHLDLSQLRFSLCGSEMIRPETVQAFCELVADTGFKPASFRPCYGMAEATLAATFDGKSRGVRSVPTPAPSQASPALDTQAVVCVGTPVPETEVRVVADDGQTLPQGQLGEVWVKGPAVLRGYFRNEAATAATITGQWLRTGDLGFVHDDELYIAGRIKEILVIRGENIMPHEIEWLADAARVATTAGERSAAFAVNQGAQGEGIVVVLETSDSDPASAHALERAVRSRVGQGLSLPLADIVVVRRGQLPRTSSGKIQRGRLRADYLNGLLERLIPPTHPELAPGQKKHFNPTHP